MSALETVQSLLLLNQTWSPRRAPRSESSVPIEAVPVTSMFPLNPPEKTSNSGVTAGPAASMHPSQSSAGARTNIPGILRSTKTTSTSQNLLVTLVTQTVLMMMMPIALTGVALVGFALG